MQLTPEQKDLVERAKASGQRRVMLQFTAGQKAAWQEAIQKELDGKEENIAQLRRIKASAEQPGFFGDVRRAIILSRRPVQELAGEIGVDARLLSEFRSGDAELPSAALDRLLDVLGLRLMLEIPR